MRTGQTAPINYNEYQLDRVEKLRYIGGAGFMLFIFGIIFFDNVVIAGIFASASLLYPKYKIQDLIQNRKTELNMEFKDVLYSLASSLGAGQSLEMAFKTALWDLRILYPDGKALIVRDLEHICRKIELNEPVEKILSDFAYRSGIEDIKDFARVISICKRTGGNIVEVVKNTAEIIGEKIQISHEISLLLSRQKYELKVLNITPLIFVSLIRFGGSGYMEPLYSSLKGYLILSLSFIILAASYVLSRKIFDIEV